MSPPAAPGFPPRVHIVEVGPRDGLQNERRVLPAPTRVKMVEDLLAAGLTTIEVGSFVSPRWVPQMAGTAEVVRALPRREGVVYPVLVPNLKGLEQAIEAGARTVAVFAATTEGFSRANLNADRAAAMRRFSQVIREALAAGLSVRGYLSCAVHCPCEGWVDPTEVAGLAAELAGQGCYEVSLCDTTGQGTPGRAARMVEAVLAAVPAERLAVHFHDTTGTALANTEACLRLGVTTVDSAVAGLGGCPYSPGAAGNLATEKLVARLHELGIETGVDLHGVSAAARRIAGELGRSHWIAPTPPVKSICSVHSAPCAPGRAP